MEGLQYIQLILSGIVAYIIITLLTRYVFLENGLSGKVQKIYHAVSLLTVAAAALICPESDFFWIIIVLSTAINISLGRKKGRITGTLLAVPIVGFADGLLLPFVVMPEQLFALSVNTIMIYQIIFFVIILILVGIAYLAASKWRRKFRRELYDRDLKMWERVMLCVIGLLLAAYSTVMNIPFQELSSGSSDFRSAILIMGLSCFAMTITVIIVILVGNKQSYYHTKVSNMQFNIIIMMAEIVENRDKNTGGHIKRTAKYVEIIAKQLKKNGMYKEILTDEYINNMIVAAPLHDIGKIHVSDIILNKPGRLTDEEFDLMKSHAAEGRNLLNHAKKHLGNFKYLDVATDMAGAHHEWWDGSRKGYPDQLSGEEIPLCARIMAVADVFDALTSKRCYKEAMPMLKAFHIIREESGTHFDPNVVKAFFDAVVKIEEALKQFSIDSETENDCLRN